MQRIDHKQGDTLLFECQRLDSANNVMSLADVVITSTIADGATFFRDLLVATVDEANGQYKVSATAEETALWPVCQLYGSIQYTSNTATLSTETFVVNMLEDFK